MTYDRRAVSLSLLASSAALCGLSGAARAQTPQQLEAFPPFKIAGNLYFVGVKDTQDYLVTTPQGHILINTDWEQNLPKLRDSVTKLGFKFSDIKILLISHAHVDHCAAAAAIKAETGARYMVMEGDVGVVESGGISDSQQDTPPKRFPPTKVDRVLHDGDKVTLGGMELVAHLTPGHTRGCTTWTMKVQDGGKSYNVVIDGGDTIAPGLKFVGNTTYPNIVEDYQRMFRTLKSLPCDIFLGPHSNYYGMEAKYAKAQANPGTNPFIDPQGYTTRVAQREERFLTAWNKQKAGPGQ